MRQLYFYAIFCGFSLGVALSFLFPVNIFYAFFLFFISTVAILFFSGTNYVKIFFIFLIFLGLGIVRTDIHEMNHRAPDIFNKNVAVSGEIVEEPDERETLSRYIVKINLSEAKNLKVLVTSERFPRYEYGEKIFIEGALVKTQNFAVPDGTEFDYVSYLAKEKIFYEIKYPKISSVGSVGGSAVKRALFKIKHSFVQNIESVLPEPTASLLAGLLVGAKHSLGKDLEDDFRKVGIIHIVVLSGYNITIVADSILRILSFLPKMWRLSASALGIILFAIMTGGTATIIRASIMALIAMLAKMTGRTFDGIRALIIAALVMIMQNPSILLYDSSFELSFLATFGLITVSPIFKKYFSLIPEKFGIRNLISETVGTQLFLLPLLLYKVGIFSIVALPVNLLILPIIPLTMLIGFIVAAVGFISVAISAFIAYAVFILLSYELAVVEIFSNIPYAAITINHFPFWLLLLAYFIYTVLLWKFRRNLTPA